MNEEIIREVFSDEAFVKSLLELDTPEDVQQALAEKDIDLSVDEIKTLAELLQKKSDGELTDEDLENVAGGSIGVGILITVLAAWVIVPGAAVVHRETRRRW